MAKAHACARCRIYFESSGCSLDRSNDEVGIEARHDDAELDDRSSGLRQPTVLDFATGGV
jgi:hypothetical protein